MDSLANHYFYYSKPSELNDPFEINIHTVFSGNNSEIRSWCNHMNITSESEINKIVSEVNNGTINKRITENQDKIRDIFIVLCMSSVWNESKLWAHYADSFKGVCLGFNTLYENNAYSLQLSNEKNIEHLIIADKITKREILLEVEYSLIEPIIYNPIKDNYDNIKKGILSKEPKWSYEKEYRSVIPIYNNKETNQKINYRKNILKEVYFGFRTPKKDIQEIYSIIKSTYSRNIKYYSVLSDSNTMCLERRLMSLNEME